MELIQGFIQPPKVQSAEETIPTLCDRVENATLINDRRSAVLGLKAFSREYRESVVASGLKPLINTLKRDYVDENTVKAILETLLILFIRGDGDDDLTRNWISQQSRLQNGKYPSPLVMKQEKQQADQFSLWIADAITQSDELVHLLIQLLETGNFHIRLYTIQLLEAVVAARPTRSRSAIISLPTGVSTLVSLLDDIHEPIRDEAILLLMAVVNESSHVQVLVAFENIFGRLFTIIEEEGGLRGSLVVNDCLSLIHNILKYNTSNQTLFLETGNLPRLAHVINEPLSGEEFFWNEQRVVNINTALDIVSLTVDRGSSTTSKNQTMLLEASVLMIVLRLAFHYNIPKNVRPVALLSAADMIRGNLLAQQEFSKIDVPYFDPSLPSPPSQDQLLPIVNLLLNWAFYTNSVHLFSLRVASVELLKSYLHDNGEMQVKFLSQQINNYHAHAKESAFLKSNLFEAILDYDLELKLNPYKLFFAADMFMHLFESDASENNTLREMTRKVTTGSGLDEEEKLSAIQALSELIITSLTSEDIRIPISYITFLIFWIYGDQNAINDFLSNRGVIQSLLSFSYQVESDDITVKCLVTMLLGVSYEFSSKNSPFPRESYFKYITKTLGKDNYLSRISQFKSDSMFAKAPKEISLNPTFDETGLPRVYFSPYFVTFFTENYYRIKTALLHSCEEEPYAKISYETFEEVQSQCNVLRQELKRLESDSSTSLLDLEKKLHSLTEEHESLVKDHNDVQQSHEKVNEQISKITQELKETSASLKAATDEKNKLLLEKKESNKSLENISQINAKSKEKLQSLEIALKSVSAAKEKAEDGINKMNRELMALTRTKGDLESKLKESQKKNEKLANEYGKKERALEDLVTQKDRKLSSLKSELDGRQEKIANLNSERDILIKESAEWKSKFHSHDKLIPKMSEKLQSVTQNCKQLQIERDELSKLLEECKSESVNELSALKNSFESLSAVKNQLLSEKEELTENLTALQKEYDNISVNHEIEKSKLEEEVRHTSERVSGLERDLHKTIKEKDDALKKASELQKRCDEYEKNIQAQISANEKGERHIDELKQSVEIYKKELTEAAEQRHELSTVSDLHSKEAKKLREEIRFKAEELKTFSERFELLEKEIKEKQEIYGESEKKLNERLNTIQEEKEQVLVSNQDAKKELEQLKSVHASSKEKSSAKVDELQNRISELQEERSNGRNTIEELNSKLERESKSLENLREEQENDSRLIKDLKSQVDSVSLEKEKLLVEKSSLEKEMSLCKQNFGNIENELKASQKKYQELRMAEKKAINELEELQKINKSESEERGKEREASRQAKTEADAQLNECQRLLGERQKKIDDLKAERNKISSELSKLQKNSQRAEKELLNLRNELKEKVQDFEKERILLNEGSDSITKQYSEKITKLEEQLRQTEIELQSTAKELENSKSAKEDAQSELQASLSEKISKISSLELKIDDQEKRANKAERSLELSAEEGDKKVHELEKNLEKVKKDIIDREIQIKSDNDELKGYSEKNKLFEHEIADLNKKLEICSINLEKLEVDKSSAEEKLKEATEDRDGSNKKLEAKIGECAELQKKLEEKSSSERNAKDMLERTIKENEAKIAELLSQTADVEDLRKELKSKSDELQNFEKKEQSSKDMLEKTLREKNENVRKLENEINNTKNLERVLELKSAELQKLSDEKTSMIDNLEKLLKDKDEKLVGCEAEKVSLTRSNKKLQTDLELHLAKSSTESSTKEENEKLKTDIRNTREELNVIQEALDASSSAIAQHEQRNSSLDQEKTLLSAKIDELSEKYQRLALSSERKEADFNTKDEQMKRKIEDLLSELENVRREIIESKNQTAENKPSASTSEGNSEVDDLMLLVTDLDEKNFKYKARLKELGVELSSDEDNDGDESDEDDEDN